MTAILQWAKVGKARLERMCALIRDEERPWQPGAQCRLRELGNEDEPDV